MKTQRTGLVNIYIEIVQLKVKRRVIWNEVTYLASTNKYFVFRSSTHIALATCVPMFAIAAIVNKT